MAGPKSVNKMVIFFCLGRVGIGVCFEVFAPVLFPFPVVVCFSPSPFSSLVSLFCALNFFYIFWFALRVTAQQNDKTIGYFPGIVLNAHFNLFEFQFRCL